MKWFTGSQLAIHQMEKYLIENSYLFFLNLYMYPRTNRNNNNNRNNNIIIKHNMFSKNPVSFKSSPIENHPIFFKMSFSIRLCQKCGKDLLKQPNHSFNKSQTSQHLKATSAKLCLSTNRHT